MRTAPDQYMALPRLPRNPGQTSQPRPSNLTEGQRGSIHMPYSKHRLEEQRNGLRGGRGAEGPRGAHSITRAMHAITMQVERVTLEQSDTPDSSGMILAL